MKARKQNFKNKSLDKTMITKNDSSEVGCGALYVVATPIGNMEDMTIRAIRILKEVSLILCENVSEASRLLRNYEIHTATSNYFSNSKLSKIDKIIDRLENGESLALISDAGTPGVSDPGSMLIQEIYKHNKAIAESESLAQKSTIKIVTIPGPSALTAAYSISGLYGNNFTFMGFAPQKKGRETFFKELEASKYNIVFYESVHRIEKCLQNIKTVFNLNTEKEEENKNRKVIIARELTKIYEELVSGNIEEVIKYYEDNKDKIKGEFVILIEGSKF